MSQLALAGAGAQQCADSASPTIGQAHIVRRRTPTFPTRWASYFDATPFGGGYTRVQAAPGAVVLRADVCMDIRTGHVYRDRRLSAFSHTGMCGSLCLSLTIQF